MTTPYPTLPSTWSPSSQCIASTAFYYVVERTFTISETIPAGIIFSLMYGIPTPTVYGTITNQTPSGTCVPPSFTTDVPYITDSNSCPTGYSIACASGSSYSGAAASAITCCPSGVYNFACGMDPYGCTTLGTVGQTWNGYRTDIQQSTEEPDAFTVGENDYLFAWGIKLLYTPPVPTSTTPVSSTRTVTTTTPGLTTTSNTEFASTAIASSLPSSSSSFPPSSSSSSSSPSSSSPTATTNPKTRLSKGVIIGIAVGVSLGFIAILALLVWFIISRRRQARDQGVEIPDHDGDQNMIPELENYYKPTQRVEIPDNGHQNMIPELGNPHHEPAQGGRFAHVSPPPKSPPAYTELPVPDRWGHSVFELPAQ